MSDPKVRSTATGQGDGLAGAAGDIGEGLYRLGTAALSAPAVLLPPEMREDARGAARDFVGAVGKLHLGIARLGIDMINSFTRALGEVAAPAAKKE